jgi:hypothetical protein
MEIALIYQSPGRLIWPLGELLRPAPLKPTDKETVADMKAEISETCVPLSMAQ